MIFFSGAQLKSNEYGKVWTSIQNKKSADDSSSKMDQDLASKLKERSKKVDEVVSIAITVSATATVTIILLLVLILPLPLPVPLPLPCYCVLTSVTAAVTDLRNTKWIPVFGYCDPNTWDFYSLCFA